jgi:hypothetical protein
MSRHTGHALLFATALTLIGTFNIAHADPALTGNGDAYNQLVILPDSIVQRWLPADLELAPVPGFPSGSHPVLFIFEEQHNVQLAGLQPLDYLEQAILVPFVRFVGGTKTYNFMPRLFVDQLAPILIGDLWGFAKRLAHVTHLWAYAKRLAHVTQKRSSWDIRDRESNTPLLTAAFTPQGDANTIDHFPNFTAALGLFGDSYVGETQLGPICGELDYDLTVAKVQSVQATVTVANAFLDALPVTTWTTDGISVSPLGAFRLTAPYTLSAPHACAR